jgi:phosphopantothenate-cysteine ligase
VPDEKMVEHKIQSSDGGLSLTLAKVPKILKPLVREWAPQGFVVSFKLETDEALLKGKAKGSLKVYGHQVIYIFSNSADCYWEYSFY